MHSKYFSINESDEHREEDVDDFGVDNFRCFDMCGWNLRAGVSKWMRLMLAPATL